jgi:hypothetical protein
VNGLVGGGLAVGLITVANAALPRIQHTAPTAAGPRVAQPAAAKVQPAAAPSEPPALIAFQEPAPGYPVISPFGLRQLPWEGGGRLHAGGDIAAPAGLPARAAADGVVTRIGVDGGYGRFVEIKHAAGLSTRYGHLGRFLPQVTTGVAVKAGQPIGEIGSSGSSTGAHLHFEIRDAQDRPLNPEFFLGRRFAEAKDLPLGAAQRFGREVRVAYVSNIPQSRRDQMQAKLEGQMAPAAAAASTTPLVQLGSRWLEGRPLAAGDVGMNVSAVAPELRLKNGRPHAQLRVSQ